MSIQVTVSGATVSVTLTRLASEVEEYVRGLKSSFNKEKIVMGLDVEWTSTDPNSRVAILQLCHKDDCLIVQMAHLDYVRQLLKEFLADSNVIFVEVGITGDVSKLQKDYGLKCQNFVEIGELVAKKMHCPHLADAGLVQLACEVLGLQVKKIPDVARRTDWSAMSLIRDRMVYAATDAYVSYLVSDELFGEK